MRLTDLEPHFLIIDEPGHRYHETDVLAGSDGIEMLCPKCFQTNDGSVGTHHIICWKPHVPPSEAPGPGRWEMLGTGYHDLTFRAGSSSVLLPTAPCKAHFLVQNGAIIIIADPSAKA